MSGLSAVDVAAALLFVAGGFCGWFCRWLYVEGNR